MKQQDQDKQDARAGHKVETGDRQGAGTGPVEDEVARARLDKRREAVTRRCAAVLQFRRFGLPSENSDVTPPPQSQLTPEELDEIEAHGF